jgi:hypothetical protein
LWCGYSTDILLEEPRADVGLERILTPRIDINASNYADACFLEALR